MQLLDVALVETEELRTGLTISADRGCWQESGLDIPS